MPQLLALVDDCMGNGQRQQRLLQVLTEEYITSVLGIFAELEITENAEHLAHLYHVVKSMLFINDTALIELLLGDRFVIDVMG
eukprot:SAG22_NODE_9057_length_612_cov_1.105263_1_plen_82_part_10